MKLAVSNIAWAPKHRDYAYAMLNEHGIRGLEIAPGLFLNGAKDPFEPTPEESKAALAPMRAAGLELVSMQSLLFGVEGAALFGEHSERQRFEQAMLRAIRLAGILGIPNLVFGSPGQRVIPKSMSREEAESIAVDLFRRLGDAAVAEGTILGMEFNPKVYGTNFLNHAKETAAFVAHVNHPAIQIILDVGAMHLNGDFETLPSFVAAQAARISHVHFSEPYLAPAPADSNQAHRVFRAMSAVGYRRWYSIEMKAVPDGELEALGFALGRLKHAVQQFEESMGS
jgi:sugar phosphate isomerase/epimerase